MSKYPLSASTSPLSELFTRSRRGAAEPGAKGHRETHLLAVENAAWEMGFAVPLSAWFRGPLRERVKSSLSGDVLADFGFIVIIYLVCQLNSIIIMRLFKCVVD